MVFRRRRRNKLLGADLQQTAFAQRCKSLGCQGRGVVWEGEKRTYGTTGISFVGHLWDTVHRVRGKDGPSDQDWPPASTVTWLHPVTPARGANCPPAPSASPEGLACLCHQELQEKLSNVAQFGRSQPQCEPRAAVRGSVTFGSRRMLLDNPLGFLGRNSVSL